MRKGLLLLFAFIITVLAAIAAPHFRSSDLEVTILTENGVEKVHLQSFYQPEKSIKTAFLAQGRHEDAALNRRNFQIAVLTLFANIPKEQEIENIIAIYDPDYPETDPEIIGPQAEFAFPEADFYAIYPEAKNELELYSKIADLKNSKTLIILHSYHQNSADPLIREIQNHHFKNAYDNFTKATLDSIPFTNREAVKAVYQISKDSGNRKALPTLSDDENSFRIKFIVEGENFKSGISTLSFYGDIMLGRYVRTLMDRNTLDYPFAKFDQSFFRANDLLIGNLEGPIAENPIQTSKAIAFRFKPDVAPLLAKYHFDGLSMANNHALDMGEQGLEDSYRYLAENGIEGFGHPRDLERIWIQEVNGRSFAFIGLNDVNFKVNQEDVVTKIKELVSNGHLVIPVIHFGVEYRHQPEDYQVKMTHEYIDAGAIAVVGHHPHVIQSLEIYKGKPIFYSLGNTVFDQYFSSDTQEGLNATFRITDQEIVLYLLPFHIKQSQMELMSAEERKTFLERFVTYWRYDQETKDQILKGKITLPIEKEKPIE